MGMKRLISLFGLGIVVLASVHTADLGSIVDQAKRNSSTIQLITLSKRNSDISIAQSEVDESIGIQVSGDLSYREQNFGTLLAPDILATLSAKPSVVISFPDGGNTAITISASSISRALSSTKDYWSADPTVTVSHTFRFGDTGDTLDDLRLARQRLEIDQTYQQRLYDFESSIYSKIIELLGYEMNLLNHEKDLLVQGTKIENALKLKTTAVGSTTFRSMELELARLENAKSATLQRLAMAKTQYKQLTGLDWSGVEGIRSATLTFSPMALGDTSVILSSLDLEIAKEQLALQQRRSVKTGGTSTVPSLTISGSTGLDYTKVLTETISYGVSGSAQYSTKSFSTGASFSLGISDTGKVTPTVTVSGSWRNNPTLVSDVLTIQSLENAVTIAGINYQEAMLAYRIKANQLESDILAHKLDLERFKQSVELREQVLAQSRDALERGLVTQTEADQALLDVELSNYERNIYALQALILENRAKALQL